MIEPYPHDFDCPRAKSRGKTPEIALSLRSLFFSPALCGKGRGKGEAYFTQNRQLAYREGGASPAQVFDIWSFFFLRKGTYFSCTEIEKHLFDSWHGFERYGILTLYEEEEEEETKTGLSTFGSAYHASFPRLRDSIMAPESFFADIFSSSPMSLSLPHPRETRHRFRRIAHFLSLNPQGTFPVFLHLSKRKRRHQYRYFGGKEGLKWNSSA